MRINLRRGTLVSAVLLALGAAGPAASQSEFFENFDTEPGVGCTLGGGGAGTYPYPTGWLKFNVDGRTPAASVSYVNEAWEVREDFQLDSNNCVAFSTSWYTPAGQADDWTWTPAIAIPSSGSRVLKWRARTYDPLYRDGYEVRIKTGDAPTLANQTGSTVVFSTAAEESGAWINRSVSLSTYAGETVYVGFRNNSTDQFLLVIDDVEVIAQFANLTASTPRFSSEYPRVASGQSVDALLGVTAVNSGSEPLTNINASAQIKHNGVDVGLPLLSTPIATLAAGVSASVSFPIGYTFNADGSWTIEYELTANESTSESSLTDNNVLSDVTVIGDIEFARHEGAVAGVLGIGAGNGGEFGNQFTVTAASSFEGVRFTMAPTSAAEPGAPAWEGQTVVANLRGWNAVTNRPGDLIATTEGITSTLQGGVYDVRFATGLQALEPGIYVVSVVEPTGGPAMPMATHDSRFTAQRSWVNWPTIPGGDWAAVEGFGASFARPPAVSLLAELPLFRDGFDGVDQGRSPAPAMGKSELRRKAPETQIAKSPWK